MTTGSRWGAGGRGRSSTAQRPWPGWLRSGPADLGERHTPDGLLWFPRTCPQPCLHDVVHQTLHAHPRRADDQPHQERPRHHARPAHLRKLPGPVRPDTAGGPDV